MKFIENFKSFLERFKYKDNIHNIIEPNKFNIINPETPSKIIYPKFEYNGIIFKPEYLDEEKNILRKFQLDAIESTRDEDKGQINIPTGTGKTRIQRYIHVEDMVKKTKNNETGIYVIAAHRLVLCNQLFEDFCRLIFRCGLNVYFVHIGSAKFSVDSLIKRYANRGYSKDNTFCENTTDQKRLLEIIDKNQKNKHIFTISTYDSFDVLECLQPGSVNICTFDEAHTTVTNEFTEKIKSVLDKKIINKRFSFTATRKIIGDTGGQNDIDLYGGILYKMSSKEAIEQMEIVPPDLHVVTIEEEPEEEILRDNKKMLRKTIMESFLKHKNKIKEESAFPEKIGAKLLITTDGLKHVHLFNKDEPFINWCIKKKIQVFTFSSEEKEYINFSKAESRQEALDKMKSLNNEDDAIIFHYNILTEGIDLPNLTGVLLLRDMDEIKFIQNVGRACRLLKEDRKRIYLPDSDEDKIKIGEYEKMIKPKCWVIIPTFNGMDVQVVDNHINRLREEYDIPTKDKADEKVIIPSETPKEYNIRKKQKQDNEEEYNLEHSFKYYNEYIKSKFEVNFNSVFDLEDFIETFYGVDFEILNLIEGSRKRILKDVYERNLKARKECLKHYGYTCNICGFSSEEYYSATFKNVIEVHHRTQISEINHEYQIDPIKHLIPLCSNCHTIIHFRDPCYTIEEFFKIILKEKYKMDVEDVKTELNLAFSKAENKEEFLKNLIKKCYEEEIANETNPVSLENTIAKNI
jgi:superfamily II DNA or RNA helicase